MVLVDLLQRAALFLYKQSVPFIVLFDDLYQKYFEEKQENINLEKSSKYIFDYELDIIKVNYNINDKQYIFCINRTNPLNLKKIVETELEEIKETEDFILSCELNGRDITNRLNMYVGSEGCHLKHNDLKIKYFLTQEEIDNFEKLFIIDSMCNETEYHSVNDLLDLDVL